MLRISEVGTKAVATERIPQPSYGCGIRLFMSRVALLYYRTTGGINCYMFLFSLFYCLKERFCRFERRDGVSRDYDSRVL